MVRVLKVLLCVLILLLVVSVSYAEAQRVDENHQCIPVDFNGIELNVFLYVDPSGGSNACSQGMYAGYLPITLDTNLQAHVSCWDNFHLSGADRSGGDAAKANIYRAFASGKSSYCARLGAHDQDFYDSRDPVPLTASDRVRVHGKIYSSVPQLELEFTRGRVHVRPRQACCTKDKQCAGQITSGVQVCPKGSKPARKNSTCAICRDFSFEPEPDPASEVSGCCVKGACDADLPAEACSIMYGTSLPKGVLCSSSENPCDDYTGACVISEQNCKERLTQSECVVLSPGAHFLQGQACPKPKIPLGGCCDPMGICRTSKESECSPPKGEFFAGGCPVTCPPQSGACTLSCPNGLGVRCISSTFQECMQSGGVGFNSANTCPTDPVLLMCEPPPCYECRDLVLQDTFWPTLDGKLYLFEDCSNEFIDGGGFKHKGNWECVVKGDRRWVRIVWSNNKEVTLWVHEDGTYTRLVLEETQERDATKFPCGSSDLKKKPEGEMGTRVGRVKFVRSGSYLCATNKAYYVKEGKGEFSVYVFKQDHQQYEYAFKVLIEKTEQEKDGSTLLLGTSQGGKMPTPWKFKFFNK